MAASATDYFHKVGYSTATTLSAPGYTIGDVAITVASTTNWPTGTGVTFAIDNTELSNGEYVRTTGTYNVFRGVVSSATSITSVTYVGGDANRNYSAGSTTRVYILVSSYRDNRFVDGIITSLDQDGTLKAGAVDVTAVIGSGVVEQLNLREKLMDYQMDFISSGGVIAKSSGLIGTFSNMNFYISGVKYAKSSVSNKTYTASKDTYIDAANSSDATLVFTEVSNGAASPSLAASSIRLGKVVTDGSGITDILQSGFDSIGNQYYPNLIPKVDAVTGWNTAGETWTYVSATTFTVPMDVTGKYQKCTEISWVQTTVKYGYVLSSTYAVATGLTTVTIVTNSDYTLANAAITNPRYSYIERPQNFPVYFNFVPTWTNVTVGNSTNEGRFSVMGKRVHVTSRYVQGTTGSITGIVGQTPPMTALAAFNSSFNTAGWAHIEDSGVTNYHGRVRQASTTNFSVDLTGAATTYTNHSQSANATNPHTWGTGDTLALDYDYWLA